MWLLVAKIISKFKNYLNKQKLIKIDHVYYSHKIKTYVIAFRVKFKYKIFEISLNEVIESNKFLEQLSQYDNLVLGKFLSCQHHKILDSTIYSCNPSIDSSEILVYISKIDFINKSLTLQHIYNDTTINIPLSSLKDNWSIITSLSNKEAFNISYRFI